MDRPKDFELAQGEGWYRLPEKKVTAGVFFDYVAFHFTAAFAGSKWAIHYFARRLGHELLTRRELLPDEPITPVPAISIANFSWDPCRDASHPSPACAGGASRSSIQPGIGSRPPRRSTTCSLRETSAWTGSTMPC